MKTRIVLTLIAASTLAGCGRDSGSNRTASSPRSTRSPSRPSRLAATRVDVRNLTPPGVEPHDLELSGGDIRTIADADLVLYLGGGFQPTLEDAIDSTSANAVDLLPTGSRRTPTSGSIRSGTP